MSDALKSKLGRRRWRERWKATLVFGATFAFLPMSTHASKALQIPLQIVDERGAIAWVSGRALTDPGLGRLNAQPPEWLVSRLQAPEASRPADPDCFDFSPLETHAGLPLGFQPLIGFEAVIGAASTVLFGTVMAAESGLADARWPEVLLDVEVDDWIARHPRIEPVDAVYVRVSVSRLRVAGVDVCRPGSRHLGRAPRAGDRIIVLKFGPPLKRLPSSKPLLYAGSNVVFERNGRIWTSDRIYGENARGLRSATLEQLVARARELKGVVQ